MIQVLLSAEFERWLDGLRDVRGKIKVVARLQSMAAGNLGDTKFVGDRVYELRIHFGPGYRLYYTRRGETVYLMLAAGDKATQSRDIRRAKALAATIDRMMP